MAVVARIAYIWLHLLSHYVQSEQQQLSTDKLLTTQRWQRCTENNYMWNSVRAIDMLANPHLQLQLCKQFTLFKFSQHANTQQYTTSVPYATVHLQVSEMLLAAPTCSEMTTADKHRQALLTTQVTDIPVVSWDNEGLARQLPRAGAVSWSTSSGV